MIYRLVDMHCHLDFADNARELADSLAECGVGAFSTTVHPADYERATHLLEGCTNVRVGAGLHPWWVKEGVQGEEALERALANVSTTRFVGEVGLDFAPKRAKATRETQVAVFECIAAACAQEGNKAISIHAVRSAGTVLDTLERCDALTNNACIFHWFSGTSDELQRAVKLGCFFSVGLAMVTSKRGRAYAQAIPIDRLLLETDMEPAPGSGISAGEWTHDLEITLNKLARALREEPEVLAERIALTSRSLLSW